MAYIVMAYSYGLYSYGLYSYGLLCGRLDRQFKVTARPQHHVALLACQAIARAVDPAITLGVDGMFGGTFGETFDRTFDLDRVVCGCLERQVKVAAPSPN